MTFYEGDHPEVIIKEIPLNKVEEFLRSQRFTTAFNRMITRTREYEQGLVVCSLESRKGLEIIKLTGIDENTGILPLEELRRRKLVPLLGIHTHPIEDKFGLAPYAYYPARQDLATPSEWWDEMTKLQAASALIVASHPPQAWLWQRPPDKMLKGILKEHFNWERTLTGYPTQKDIDDLKIILREAGLKLTTGVLNGKNHAYDFATLFLRSGLRLGFS